MQPQREIKGDQWGFPLPQSTVQLGFSHCRQVEWLLTTRCSFQFEGASLDEGYLSTTLEMVAEGTGNGR